MRSRPGQGWQKVAYFSPGRVLMREDGRSMLLYWGGAARIHIRWLLRSKRIAHQLFRCYPRITSGSETYLAMNLFLLKLKWDPQSQTPISQINFLLGCDIRHNAVRKVTGYGLDDWSLIPGWGRDFSSLPRSDWRLGPYSLLSSGSTMYKSRGRVKLVTPRLGMRKTLLPLPMACCKST